MIVEKGLWNYMKNLNNKKNKRLFMPIYDMYSFSAIKKQWQEVFERILGENYN